MAKIMMPLVPGDDIHQTVHRIIIIIFPHQVSPVGNAQLLSMDCPYGTEGQFAVIYKERSWYLPLQLCEVEIIGGPAQGEMSTRKYPVIVNELW